MVSATVFYNQVTSLTAFNSSGGIRPETDPFGRTQGYLNSSGGFSRGVEIGLEARPTAALRLSGGYTYTRSETDGGHHGSRLLHRARRLRAHGDVRRDQRAGANASTRHSTCSTDRAMYGSFFAAGRPRAYRYPGFTKAALMAGYRVVNSRRVPLRAYVKVDNLFDQTYYEIGWRNLGRTVVAGFSVGS